jgi:hypothetical protein
MHQEGEIIYLNILKKGKQGSQHIPMRTVLDQLGGDLGGGVGGVDHGGAAAGLDGGGGHHGAADNDCVGGQHHEPVDVGAEVDLHHVVGSEGLVLWWCSGW